MQESAARVLINTEHLVYSQVPSKRVYSITNMYPTEQEDIAHREGTVESHYNESQGEAKKFFIKEIHYKRNVYLMHTQSISNQNDTISCTVK